MQSRRSHRHPAARPARARAPRAAHALGACTLLVIALLAGCASSPTIRTLAAPDLDLDNYTSFGFFSPLGTDRAQYASVVSERLKAQARREMEARGFVYSEEEPDLLINFNAKLEDKLRTVRSPTPSVNFAWTGGYYGYRTGLYTAFPMYEQTEVREYQQGTLNIDLVDAQREQLVWEGVSESVVTQRTMENLEESINEAVSAIFAKFPR